MQKIKRYKLKIGDRVELEDNIMFKGVIVYINSTSEDKKYNVHWYPSGRGMYSYNQLNKIRALAPKLEPEPE